MFPTPSGGAPDAGMIQMLALVIPVLAVLVVVTCLPGVRELFTDRTRKAREFFYGPEVDLQAGADPDVDDADADAADGVAVTATPVPDWFDPSIFDEDADDDLDHAQG